jgi:hypothetical protein
VGAGAGAAGWVQQSLRCLTLPAAGVVRLPGSQTNPLAGRLTRHRVVPALAVVCPPPGGFVSPPPAPEAPEEPLAPPDDPMDVLPCGYVFPKRKQQPSWLARYWKRRQCPCLWSGLLQHMLRSQLMPLSRACQVTKECPLVAKNSASATLMQQPSRTPPLLAPCHWPRLPTSAVSVSCRLHLCCLPPSCLWD